MSSNTRRLRSPSRPRAPRWLVVLLTLLAVSLTGLAAFAPSAAADTEQPATSDPATAPETAGSTTTSDTTNSVDTTTVDTADTPDTAGTADASSAAADTSSSDPLPTTYGSPPPSECPDPYSSVTAYGGHEWPPPDDCPPPSECPDPYSSVTAYGGHESPPPDHCPPPDECPDPYEAGVTATGGYEHEGPKECPPPPMPPAEPAADASLVCPATNASVVLRNLAEPGAASVIFTVTAPAGVSPAFSTTTEPVGPGDEVTVLVPFAEDETRTITVVGNSEVEAESVVATGAGHHHHDFYRKFTLTRSCGEPAASVGSTCAASGLDVSVTNIGTDSGLFAINGTSGVLEPDETLVVNVPVAEGATVEVTVTIDGTPIAGSPFSFTRNCENPAATATRDCDAGGARVTMSNSGPSGTVLTVLKNGVAVATVPVAAGATVQQIFPLQEDETATFRITGPGGFDSGDFPILFDCIQVGPATVTTTISSIPLQVSGVVVSRLAFTGGGSGVLAIQGAVLVIVGTLALLASRRRRPSKTA